MKIGNKVKELRLAHDLTQQELADRCELTKGYISQLENDLTEPSVTTLEDIINALGSNFKDFFSSFDDEKVVFTDDDYSIKQEKGYDVEWLVTNSQKNEMEPIRVTLQKDAITELDRPHNGEEFGYVVEGMIELNIGKKTYDVLQGESFCFKADRPHFIKNINNGTSIIIWISSPPNF